MKYTLFIRLVILLFFLKSFGQSNSDYTNWENTFDQGFEFFEAKNFNDALPIFKKAYDLGKIIFVNNEEEFAETAYQLAYTYDILRDYKKSLPLYLEALNNLRLNNKEKEPYFAKMLLRVGTIYGFIGDFDNSIKLLEEGLKLIEMVQGKENLYYSQTLNKISIAYKKIGDYDKAIKYNKSSNEIIENLLGNQNSSYAKNLTSLSQIYIEMGLYDEALTNLNKALSILKDQDRKDIAYIQAVFTKAVLSHNQYDFKQEIKLLEEVKSLTEQDKTIYISANNNLAVAYEEMGDYEKALSIALEVANSTAENDPNYPVRLQNVAYSYSELGEFSKALKTYDLALKSSEKIFGLNHPKNADILDCMGQLYLKKGDLVPAKELFEEALEIFLKNFDTNHSEYGFYLNHYTNALLELNQYDEAIDLMHKNLKISEANSSTENIVYYQKQHALAKAYYQIGNYNEALKILSTYLEKLKEKLGNDHADYGAILKTLWKTYVGLDEINKAIPIIDSSNAVHFNQIDKVFKFRSEKEKKAFLKITNQNFDEIQSVAFRSGKQIYKLNEINLNNQIILKGLLLNNSKNLMDQLTGLNNPDINNKLQSYRSSKIKLTKVLSLPPEDQVLNIDSLKSQVNTKESELVRIYSSNFHDNLSLNQNWKKSKANLMHKDIAIEFSHFRYSDNNELTDSIQYVAYVFKKTWEFPVMVPLFEERQLKSVLSKNGPNQLYASRGSKGSSLKNFESLYNLIWSPLEKYVKGSNKIFFSPSGLLNQISFAALKSEKEGTLSEKYDLYQISNTGVIGKELANPEFNNALLIGGINYDSKISSVKKPAVDLKSNRNKPNKTRSNNQGDNWSYLEGTLQEVKSLESILIDKKSAVNRWSGDEATETRFKGLSGHSPNIIHIATHGFFFDNNKNTDKESQLYGLENPYHLSDDPLLRSGLIFAGANYYWNNTHNSINDDNGILTAMEIANLDLSNTDLVVLSACDTGLGDIDGNEGVYGLQRAFKMAGVDIIIMSLWQVPDKETVEFMNIFYKDWIQSGNVKKAFIETQRIMQAKYKNQPFKWAAFVLFE
ncbi:CHAT domain-containing protein [Gaetbulibacter aestuarii]|uniref:CHAT domain-containing protein n=1 Tax=Gaetbulibacter aestuarii TaxID=1502358 RepID=A0ABW7N1K9_9FLAO